MKPEFTLTDRYANAVRGSVCSLLLDISKLGRTLASVPIGANERPGSMNAPLDPRVREC